MSRNLGVSSCLQCGKLFRLSHLRGQPIEFRRYFRFPPVIGARVDCECGMVYFAHFREHLNHLGEGWFEIDLSHYETYDDEDNPSRLAAVLAGEAKPYHLSEENEIDVQRVCQDPLEPWIRGS